MAKDTATEPVEQAADLKPGELVVRKPLPKEIGGVAGPEPTRYGDWEHKGRCTDF
ncbi:MAG: DUF1674 domain-containing protein [Acetobacteraceae bacterium]|jgi:hypothetical protein